MRSFLSKASLYLLALVVLLMSFLTWSLRRQRKLQARLVALQSSTPRAQERRATQKAIALLCHALVADTQLSYTATTETTARYGDKTITTRARITRAPNMLSIAYLDGSKAGLHSGFSERWLWRQSALDEPMKAYASTERDASELATSRFATMLENYSAQWQGQEKIDGRMVDVVELWPFEAVDNAKGPGKQLWIDCENSLILKVKTFNHQGEMVMKTELHNVNFQTDVASDTRRTQEAVKESVEKQPQQLMAEDMGQDIQAVKNKTGMTPPQVAQANLPHGFKLEAVGTHRCPLTGNNNGQAGSGDYAALSRYTDGMNTLTLFSMKTPAAKDGKTAPGQESCEFGPGTLVSRDEGAVHLIAVGDLPPETLSRVLDKAQIEAPTNLAAN